MVADSGNDSLGSFNNNHNQLSAHEICMRRALNLAASNLGQTWPNPAVGAVIVKDGAVVGEGATAKGGRPHAETIALEQAAGKARGATVYVSLEPCVHYGKTPPCVDALISAGISECVIACLDPNPLVNGQSIEKLQAAGIKVTVGTCEKEARELNRGFFSVIEKKRPFIAMKIAISKDGKIAAGIGERTNITGEEARLHGQKLRAEFDALLTGSGTIIIDDPLLTVRIPGFENRSPLRVVLDSRGRISSSSRLMQTSQEIPVLIYKRSDDVIGKLTEYGITRLLIEGGCAINTSFLASSVVDRVYCYQSPDDIGKQGLDAVEGGFNADLLRLDGWQIISENLLGRDKVTIYEICSLE